MAPSIGNVATLVELLARRARDAGAERAFSFGGRIHSFGEIWTASQRFARRLARRGIAGGARVILLFPNGEEFFTAF
jgi:acyl-CoA synthetase (AMP-forming)/AMP-acid ligase II